MKVNLMRPVLGMAVWVHVALGFGASAAAESKKLALAISALSAGYAPVYIAKDAGFFGRRGLDVDLVLMPFGQLVHAMIAGDIKMAGVGASRVMASNLEGSGIVLLATTNDRHPYKLVVPPGVTQPGDLKGKTLGVGRFGGLDDTAMRYALSQFGIDPRRDVTIMQVGGKAARFAALKKGAISGIMIDPPYTLMAQKLGMKFLFDMLSSSPKMIYGTIAAKEAYIDANPGIVRNLMKGYIEAIHFYKTRKQESIKIMAKYMKIDLPEKAEEMAETYDAFVKTARCKPYVDPEGVQKLLQQLARKTPEAKGADPRRFVNMQYLRELDESGFIDSACREG